MDEMLGIQQDNYAGRGGVNISTYGESQLNTGTLFRVINRKRPYEFKLTLPLPGNIPAPTVLRKGIVKGFERIRSYQQEYLITTSITIQTFPDPKTLLSNTPRGGLAPTDLCPPSYEFPAVAKTFDLGFDMKLSKIIELTKCEIREDGVDDSLAQTSLERDISIMLKVRSKLAPKEVNGLDGVYQANNQRHGVDLEDSSLKQTQEKQYQSCDYDEAIQRVLEYRNAIRSAYNSFMATGNTFYLIEPQGQYLVCLYKDGDHNSVVYGKAPFVYKLPHGVIEQIQHKEECYATQGHSNTKLLVSFLHSHIVHGRDVLKIISGTPFFGSSISLPSMYINNFTKSIYIRGTLLAQQVRSIVHRLSNLKIQSDLIFSHLDVTRDIHSMISGGLRTFSLSQKRCPIDLGSEPQVKVYKGLAIRGGNIYCI